MSPERGDPTTILTQEHVLSLVRVVGRDRLMDELITALGDAFAKSAYGQETSPAREGFTRGGDGVLEWMPHRKAGQAITLKAVSYTPGNPARAGLPTILSVVARFDDDTGRLTHLCDGVLLTALRTGAASAVASRLFARPGASVLGQVGAGAQAVTQIHALSRVLPLSRVLVSDTEPGHAESLAKRVAFVGLDVQVVPVAALEAEADVICTATSVASGGGPVLPGREMKDDVHINAIGSDLPGKVELPEHLLRRAALVSPDHRDQALREGESQRLASADLGPDLAAFCADPGLADQYRDGITIFDSTGFALEDHVALDIFSRFAEQEGIGDRLMIEHLPQDCLDPYSPAPIDAALAAR